MRFTSFNIYGLSSIFFITALTLGSTLSYWQIQRAEKIEAYEGSSHAISSIDTILDHAVMASGAASPLQGMPCNGEVLTRIRTIVATVPDVRTVNLSRKGMIYCTSVFGIQDPNIEYPDHSVDGLRIIDGNVLSPHKPIIVLRTTNKSGDSVLVGVDGYYLIKVLQLISSNGFFYLKIGSQYLSSQGNVTNSIPYKRNFIEKSKRHEYEIVASDNGLNSLQSFVIDSGNVLLVVLIVSISMTFLFNRYIRYRNTMEYMLREAIQHRRITPWIQPIIDANTGEISGGEVLLRWNHPQKGYIPPDIFISVAEQNNMMVKLTRECFRQVSDELESIDILPRRPLMICFNISADSFKNEDIINVCHDFISNQCNGQWVVVLEITERVAVEFSEKSTNITNKLKELGVLLSLDDFGTGNANYMYLKQFSPEFIKIDKTFTSGISTDPVSVNVVENIINLAKNSGCHVVAEGIENESQKLILQNMGVSYFQGYLFSKAMPCKDFFKIL